MNRSRAALLPVVLSILSLASTAPPAMPCTDCPPDVPANVNRSWTPAQQERAGSAGVKFNNAVVCTMIGYKFPCTSIFMAAGTWCCTGAGFTNAGQVNIVKADSAQLVKASSGAVLMRFYPNDTTTAGLAALDPSHAWQGLLGQVPAGGIAGGDSTRVRYFTHSPATMSEYDIGCVFEHSKVTNASSDAVGHVVVIHTVSRVGPVFINGSQVVPIATPRILTALALLLAGGGFWALRRKRASEIA